MDNLKKIVWLASYPKSGNTWFRVFLSNLISKSDIPVDINNLYLTPIASSRELFDEATGLNSADLTLEEIDLLRPGVYEYIAKNNSNIMYQKVHDAWILTQDQQPMFDEKVTRAAIYFIRNPLDVSVSFANHLGKPVEAAIKILADNSYAFNTNPDRLHIQLRQQLLSWSNHVKSWVDHSKLPIIVIRYEDMKTKPFDTFSKIIDFIGLHFSEQEIDRAIRFSDIKELQRQELSSGFNEKPKSAKLFFRKGIVGNWKEELSADQIRKICTDHFDIMKRFGYIDNNGNPIFSESTYV